MVKIRGTIRAGYTYIPYYLCRGSKRGVQFSIMASARQHRFRGQAVGDGSPKAQQEHTTNDSAASSSPAFSSEEACRLGLESMTAKGVKHLCSELLEIKKASEEDFRRNVYLNYLAFIRMFEEADDIKNDLSDLKRHVTTQTRLVQDLRKNLYSAIISENSSEIEEMEVTPCSPQICDTHTCDPLDILLSEHRMDEALELLELESQAPGKVQNDNSSTAEIASGMSALAVRRARVADHFSLLADNPRTPQAELLKALSGLCKLGDTQRANFLLFKLYRSHVLHHVEELRCSKEFLHRNYIKELACIVFSAILQASKNFVMLHGYESSYTPELIQWAREEIEDFSIAFYEYVKSISEVSENLILAVEAAKCALSYCSLLRSLKIFLEADLIELITPCIEKVLIVHAKHLKGVIGLMVASDTWVLGRFLVSGILRVKSSTKVGARVEHCLLTSSGRTFVTLMQEVVEDISPLLNLQMKSSVLQLLAKLFREYMQYIKEVIPKKEDAFENERQASTSDHRYMWQLSVLINCTTLVALFPVIVNGIFKATEAPNEVTLSSGNDFSAQKELDNLILFIKEAAGQVWTCFCQQFIHDTLSSLRTKPRTSFEDQIFAWCLPSSPQDMMPSFAFQVLFLRLRQLNNVYAAVSAGEDGTMKKLLEELLEVLILWLSDNLDSWISLDNRPQDVCKHMLSDQIHLDVHFLLEFARLGGYSSDCVRASALELLKKAEEKVSTFQQDTNGVIREEGWAVIAAKNAVKMLMETDVDSSDLQQEPNVKNADALRGEYSIEGHAQEGIGTKNQLDDVVAGLGKNSPLDTCRNENVGLPGEQTPDENTASGCDDNSSVSSSEEFISIENDQNAIESSTEDDMSSKKLDLATTLIVPQVLDSGKGEHGIISDHESLKDIPKNAHRIKHLGADAEVSEVCGGSDSARPGSRDSEIYPGVERRLSDLQDKIADHDSSSSFTTSPELLQDSARAVRADEETRADNKNLLQGVFHKMKIDGMRSANQTGDPDLGRGDNGGSAPPSGVVQSSSSSRANRKDARPGEKAGKKADTRSRNRPIWQ